MQHLISFLLLTLVSTRAISQEREDLQIRPYSIEFAGGASVTSNNLFIYHHSYAATAAYSALISPVLAIHAGKRITAGTTLGLRAEVVLWRSKDNSEYYIPVFDPPYRTTYNFGYPALSISPYVRRQFRKGRFRRFAGAFLGFVHTFADSSHHVDRIYQQIPYSKELNMGSGNGIVLGIETGFGFSLNERTSLVLSGAGQLASVYSAQYNGVIQLLAFPATLGLSYSFGDPASFRKRKSGKPVISTGDQFNL